MSNESKELSSIKVAARTIGVTTKSIDRWLKEGTLSRIEEGRRIFIPTSEIMAMRDRRLKKKKTTSTIFKETQNTEPSKTIAIDVNEYKTLLENYGQMKGLLEAHSSRLLEYKGILEGKDKEITSLKAELDQAEKQNDEVNSWIKEVIEESKEKENEIKESKEKISHLEEQNQNIKSSSIFTIQKKDDEIEELKKNLQAFQKELDRIKSRGLLKRFFNK